MTKNSQVPSYQDVLKEYQIEGRTFTQLEKKLLVLEMQRTKSQQVLEQTRIDSELQQLEAVKNRLDKEDRMNHARLVKDSIANRSRLMAAEQKKNSVQQKEKAMKRSYDAAVEQRHAFKQGQQKRKQALQAMKDVQLLKNKQSIQKVKADKANK